MRASVRQRRRDDRGATLIVVSVFVIVAVIMLAAVIDLGNQRQERKEVTLSTDAAALAAASLADTEDSDLVSVPPETLVDCDLVGVSSLAANPEGFTNVRQAVDDYLARNGGSDFVDCKVARTSFREGYVVVSADEIVDYAFAPAIGVDSGDVAGASVAAIEVNSGGGLRPVGICALTETMAGVAGYPEITLDDLYNSSSGGYELDGDGYVVSVGDTARTTVTARFAINQVKGGECAGASGGGSGNFGKLDFGGDNRTDCGTQGYFCHDFREGYFGTLTNPTKGDTGNNWSNAANEASALNLETNVGQFWAPVFIGLSGPGNNADFSLLYFVQMEMVNHCFTGGCRFSGTTWFDFRISRMVPFTTAGPPLTDDANNKQPRLCAVDNTAAAIAAGCPRATGATTSTTAPASSTTTTTSTSTTTTTTAPRCDFTASPGTQQVLTASSRGNVTTAADVVVTLSIPTPANCGTMSIVATIGSNNVALTGAGPAAATMTFTLSSGTPLPNGSGNNSTFTMRVRNNGVDTGANPTFTTTNN